MIVVHGGYNDYYIFHSQSSQQRAADPSRWNMVRRDYDPFDTNSPLLWTPLVTPEARSQALRDNKGCCSSCHGIDHSFKHCPQYLISGGGYLNPQLGQLLLGDNGDACRRWQQRMRSRRCHVNPIGGGNTHTLVAFFQPPANFSRRNDNNIRSRNNHGGNTHEPSRKNSNITTGNDSSTQDRSYITNRTVNARSPRSVKIPETQEMRPNLSPYQPNNGTLPAPFLGSRGSWHKLLWRLAQ